MTSVMKSPNMMSTTGRMPVMAAPSAMPVNPGSEIGASITRSGPNSSTRPFRTLNGVPASATSSPMRKTDGSRRISSASASFTAWPRVSSRTPPASSGIDVLGDLVRVGERRAEAVLDALAHLGRGPLLGRVQLVRRDARPQQLGGEPRDRIALALPLLLLGTGAVGAVDVPHVVSPVAVGVADEEARAVAAPRPRHGVRGRRADREHVLPVHLHARDAERGRPRRQLARGR